MASEGAAAYFENPDTQQHMCLTFLKVSNEAECFMRVHGKKT
jgi:hypothetical protein